MAFTGFAQAMYFNSATTPTKITAKADTSITKYASLCDSLLAEAVVTDTVMSFSPIPKNAFMPLVFSSYEMLDTTSAFTPDYSGNPAFRWIEDAQAAERRSLAMRQWAFVNRPGITPYNIATLPEAPKKFVAVVNPDDHTITIHEVGLSQIAAPDITLEPVVKHHWVKDFSASLLFSQAYISPNWYQGGNNNLNAQLNLYYNVKLNQAFHPNLLFDNTFQYKLGVNSAPDDSLRNYNISEDILQINSTFGIRAAKKWFYSLTAQFKTQLVNSYTSNTNNLRSAFLSPAELTVGLGMTYNTSNAKKTFTFDASIAPLSYDLKICTNPNIKMEGIPDGKKVAHAFGSSAELKLMWQITYNITYNSRFFAFTDYKRAYCDWENTLMFDINKFLTTQIFWHLRYDTHTPKVEGSSWKKLQIKEILSIGVAYRFSSKK